MEKRFGITPLILVLMFSLTACGEMHLADDPSSEPIASVDEQELPMTPPLQEPPTEVSERQQILNKYQYLDPMKMVPTSLLEEAVLYYDANQDQFANHRVISIIDFSARSTKSRFFFVDLKDGQVTAVHVAHGKNSDPNHDGYADSFSNVSGSNQSSLGFYKTAETYYGSNGYSLRLDGLSATNSRARSRAIVIHGASYVLDSDVIQGRSWGCPAVSMDNSSQVINSLKGGSLIFAGLSE